MSSDDRVHRDTAAGAAEDPLAPAGGGAGRPRQRLQAVRRVHAVRRPRPRDRAVVGRRLRDRARGRRRPRLVRARPGDGGGRRSDVSPISGPSAAPSSLASSGSCPRAAACSELGYQTGHIVRSGRLQGGRLGRQAADGAHERHDLLDGLVERQFARVDRDRVGRRRAAVIGRARCPAGPGSPARRARPPRRRRSGRRGAPARAPADAVRNTLTSAAGHTTVPMSRPSATQLPSAEQSPLLGDHRRPHAPGRRRPPRRPARPRARGSPRSRPRRQAAPGRRATATPRRRPRPAAGRAQRRPAPRSGTSRPSRGR